VANIELLYCFLTVTVESLLCHIREQNLMIFGAILKEIPN
jgi:hypothetical protein